MIIYIAARLIATLYGCDWPLTGDARFFCVTFSFMEIVGVSAVSIVSLVTWIVEKKGGNHA